MTLYALAGMAAAMFMLAAVPGPGVYVTVSRALASGLGKTLPVIAGIVAGDLLFLLAAIYGLAAVAQTFGTLFTVVKYAGAAYLIWLGVRLWLAPAEPVAVGVSNTYGFLTGLSVTLGNPKVIFFYLGLLPTFVDLGALTGTDVCAVVLTVSLILGAVMSSYAFAAARAKRLFKSAGALGAVQKTAGGVLVGTGAVLALKN